MTSPQDNLDDRLDASLKQALKATLPEPADKRIRTHLSQQTVPGNAPAWATGGSTTTNGSPLNSIFTRRFSVLSLAAAVVIAAAGTYLILLRAEREAPPKVVDPIPPQRAKSQTELPQLSPDELWKRGENVATRSAFPNDPIQRAKVDELLLRLRKATKQRDYETVDKVTHELQELLSPSKN
jgi:hypothetical protein